MRDATKAHLGNQGPTVQLVPCTIVTTTPLTVTLNGATVPGVKVVGATYTAGQPAVALVNTPNTPLILPTGA